MYYDNELCEWKNKHNYSKCLNGYGTATIDGDIKRVRIVESSLKKYVPLQYQKELVPMPYIEIYDKPPIFSSEYESYVKQKILALSK